MLGYYIQTVISVKSVFLNGKVGLYGSRWVLVHNKLNQMALLPKRLQTPALENSEITDPSL